MAWTPPKTWSNAVLTSADFNVHIRDNLNILKTAILDNGHPYLPVVQTKSANYTALPTDDLIFCHTNSFTITLYALANAPGRLLWVVNDFNNTGTITLDGIVAELIENNTTYQLQPGARVLLVATGGAWLILARFQEPSILPRCSLYHSTTQTHSSSGSWVALTFDSEDFDVGGMHSGANPTRITIPAGFGGTWLVGGATTCVGNGGAHNIALRVRKNGGTLVGSGSFATDYSNSKIGSHITVPAVLGESEYIELEVLQTSGSSVSFGATGAARDEMSGFWAMRQTN